MSHSVPNQFTQTVLSVSSLRPPLKHRTSIKDLNSIAEQIHSERSRILENATQDAERIKTHALNSATESAKLSLAHRLLELEEDYAARVSSAEECLLTTIKTICSEVLAAELITNEESIRARLQLALNEISAPAIMIHLNRADFTNRKNLLPKDKLASRQVSLMESNSVAPGCFVIETSVGKISSLPLLHLRDLIESYNPRFLPPVHNETETTRIIECDFSATTLHWSEDGE